MVVDAYVAKLGLTWTRHGDLYEAAQARIRGRVVEFIKPLTFMNLSGQAIRKRMNECGLSPSSIVVITDEYNFPTGRIHLKAGGSSGGHNGIGSVMEELATPSFWRLRCGIDRKFGPGELVDYVLADFPAAEVELVADMISRSCDVLAEIASAGPDLAMQKANRPVQSPAP
jgi:PTH1 family peptidyl-tRNA hydrolase